MMFLMKGGVLSSTENDHTWESRHTLSTNQEKSWMILWDHRLPYASTRGIVVPITLMLCKYRLASRYIPSPSQIWSIATLPFGPLGYTMNSMRLFWCDPGEIITLITSRRFFWCNQWLHHFLRDKTRWCHLFLKLRFLTPQKLFDAFNGVSKWHEWILQEWNREV